MMVSCVAHCVLVAAAGAQAAVMAMAGVAAAGVFQVDDAAAHRAAAGKAQLELLHSDQSCSALAVEKLQNGCREMGDVEQSRLAVHFTNCHLAKSGLATYECSATMSIEACTKPMVDSPASLAYTAYTHFYTHAESMCFYLQSRAFQQSTEALVDSLASSARDTAGQLRQLHSTALETSLMSERILTEQEAAAAAAHTLLLYQQEARLQLDDLQASTAASLSAAQLAIDSASAASRSALDSLKLDTEALGSKQRSLLGGVERILNLQSALFGEFTDVKTVIFFTCAVVLAAALTSTARTGGARLPIFALLAANCAAEKALAAAFLYRRGAGGSAADVEALLGWLWLLRKSAAAGAALLLLRAAITYADLGRKAVTMLEDIQRVHRQHSDQLSAKMDAIVAATSPAPSPVALTALRFAPNPIPPVAPAAGSSPAVAAPPCAPAGPALPPPPVPFELFAHVRRQRDMANSLLRGSLARIHRRRAMSPGPHAQTVAAPTGPPPAGGRRAKSPRAKSPLARPSVSAPPPGLPSHAPALAAGPAKPRPARTPPRRSSVSSSCTVDEDSTPARRSQRVADRADRRCSID